MNIAEEKPKGSRGRKKKTEESGARLNEVQSALTALQNSIPADEENISQDILYLLHSTIQSAKENPSVNNINAVVKSLNAFKLAATVPGGKKSRKSKNMIAKRVIAFIEKEILHL